MRPEVPPLAAQHLRDSASCAGCGCAGLGRRRNPTSTVIPPTYCGGTTSSSAALYLSTLLHHLRISHQAIVESSSYRRKHLDTMAAPEVHHLFHGPIADHSFSTDHGTLAVARDNNVELYGKAGNAYKLKDQLKGHDKTVTSVDIAPNSGRIVSCSQGEILFPASLKALLPRR